MVFKVRVTRDDGAVAHFPAGSRREADLQASAIKKNFGVRVKDAQVVEKKGGKS